MPQFCFQRAGQDVDQLDSSAGGSSAISGSAPVEACAAELLSGSKKQLDPATAPGTPIENPATLVRPKLACRLSVLRASRD